MARKRSRTVVTRSRDRRFRELDTQPFRPRRQCPRRGSPARGLAGLYAAMGNVAASCWTSPGSGSLKIASSTDRTRRYRWQSEHPHSPRSVICSIKYSSCSRMTSRSSADPGTAGGLNSPCRIVVVPSSSACGTIAPPPYHFDRCVPRRKRSFQDCKCR
jgi:hypothetical protein